MRFRPRFSIRTLTIFVTLACFFVAGWNGAKIASNASVNMMWRLNETETTFVAESNVPIPFVIARNECEENVAVPDAKVITVYRRYYVWLFGPKVKLPFESRVSRRVDVLTHRVLGHGLSRRSAD